MTKSCKNTIKTGNNKKRNENKVAFYIFRTILKHNWDSKNIYLFILIFHSNQCNGNNVINHVYIYSICFVWNIAYFWRYKLWYTTLYLKYCWAHKFTMNTAFENYTTHPFFTVKRMIKVRTLLKNNTGAIFQKTISQKQTKMNLFIMDHCRRCSLASSHVRCSDVGKFHNRWMQLWVFSELDYENRN